MKNNDIIEKTKLELIDFLKSSTADKLIEKYKNSVVICAIITSNNKVFKGVNIGWWHSTCAEQVALSNAYMKGKDEIKYVITYKKHYKTKEITTLLPCGICRQMFVQLKHNPMCFVNSNDNENFLSINDLLPFGE